MAMLCAIQHYPVMKQFYNKLVAQGKHKKSRPHGVYAKNDHPTERHGPRSEGVADGVNSFATDLILDHSRLLTADITSTATLGRDSPERNLEGKD